MLAAMRAGDVERLTARVDFPLNIAVGDSLLHGYAAAGKQGELEFPDEEHVHTYRIEDIDDYIKSVHAGYLAEEVIPAVRAPVLAESWRGGSRQASLVRFLRMCDVEPMSEDLAKHVGVLAGKSGHDDIVGVAVVEGAIRRGDAVVTSNGTHICKVADAVGAVLSIESSCGGRA